MMTNELVLLTIVVLIATMLQLWREHTWRARLLEARADQQHRWTLEGDPRGTYGQDAPPSPQPMAIPDEFTRAPRAGWQASTGSRREQLAKAALASAALGDTLADAATQAAVDRVNHSYENIKKSAWAAARATRSNVESMIPYAAQWSNDDETCSNTVSSVSPGRTMQNRTSVPSVSPGARVAVHGAGCGLYVRGDVGAGARLTANGAESYIHIDGNVGYGARVQAHGYDTTIYIRGHTDPTATISAEGANAHIAMGRNRTNRETTRS